MQQFCFRAFEFKLLHAEQQQRWLDLADVDKPTLVEHVKEKIITFLNHLWKRLQGALDTASPDARDTFFKFIDSLSEKRPGEVIGPRIWNELGTEIQYILYTEGLVRYDPFQPVYYPGALLRDYLLQKVTETSTITVRSTRLRINFPEGESEIMTLSELEYRLLKTLHQHPIRCTEEELMKAGWNKVVESKTFKQKIYQLRLKLKGSRDTDVITNQYGGFYSLTHPEWLQFV